MIEMKREKEREGESETRRQTDIEDKADILRGIDRAREIVNERKEGVAEEKVLKCQHIGEHHLKNPNWWV